MSAILSRRVCGHSWWPPQETDTGTQPARSPLWAAGSVLPGGPRRGALWVTSEPSQLGDEELEAPALTDPPQSLGEGQSWGPTLCPTREPGWEGERSEGAGAAAGWGVCVRGRGACRARGRHRQNPAR